MKKINAIYLFRLTEERLLQDSAGISIQNTAQNYNVSYEKNE